MKDKPKVGQTIWTLNIGHSARHKEQVLKPEKVIKVGSKYFTTLQDGRPNHCANVFHLENWWQKTDYSPDVAAYEHPQDWEDEKEARDLNQKIDKHFQYGTSKLSLEKLRQINAIIDLP